MASHEPPAGVRCARAAGVYCFADGARYEGQYKAGKKEGRGVYQFADGSTYEGEYRNGRMDGFGAYQYSDGKTEVGRYDCGIDVGAAVRWSADRRQAWRLWDGQLIEEISLDMADRIARAIGPYGWYRWPARKLSNFDAPPAARAGRSSPCRPC